MEHCHERTKVTEKEAHIIVIVITLGFGSAKCFISNFDRKIMAFHSRIIVSVAMRGYCIVTLYCIVLHCVILYYSVSDTVVKYPKFSGTGYMAFPVLRGSHERFTMVVEFRPDIDEGLILFSADNSDVQFDFFSLTILNGRLEFR